MGNDGANVAMTTEKKMGPFDELISRIHNNRSRIEEIACDLRLTTDKVRGAEPNDTSKVEQAGEPTTILEQLINAVNNLDTAVNELNGEKNRYRELF
jgi:hypothetical protein